MDKARSFVGIMVGFSFAAMLMLAGCSSKEQKERAFVDACVQKHLNNLKGVVADKECYANEHVRAVLKKVSANRFLGLDDFHNSEEIYDKISK